MIVLGNKNLVLETQKDSKIKNSKLEKSKKTFWNYFFCEFQDNKPKSKIVGRILSLELITNDRILTNKIRIQLWILKDKG